MSSYAPHFPGTHYPNMEQQQPQLYFPLPPQPQALVPGSDRSFIERARRERQHYNQNAQARKGPKVNMQAAKKDQSQAVNAPHQYHSSPRMQPATPVTPVTHGAGSGIFIHGQYNSPLGLYSSDVATDELSQQSGGVITNVGGSDSLKISGGQSNDPCRLPEKPKKDFRDSEVYKLISENEATKRAEDARRAEEAAEMKLSGSNPSKQSLSFKVLQWMTDTEKPVEDLQDTPTASRKKQKNPLLRHNSEDDEMRFSGLHGKHDIPSKSFKMLQNLTVTDSQDDASSQDTQDDDSGQVGNYCEASIRYKGKHIPSPSFRVLQNWADHDTEPTPVRKSKPKPKPAMVDEEEEKADGPSEVRYSGGHIPSRVFKVLQMSVAGSEPVEATSSANQSEDDDKPVRSQPRQSRSMRIIQKAKIPPQESAAEMGCTDF